jgi:curli biogenesis system outer membrane secretion channel CsgG
MRSGPVRLALALAMLAAAACTPAQTQPAPTAPSTLTPPANCTPTRADVPANYKADAPVRNKIGAGGYVIDWASRVSSYTYYASGLVNTISVPGGMTTTNQYDRAQRATSLTTSSRRRSHRTSIPSTPRATAPRWWSISMA